MRVVMKTDDKLQLETKELMKQRNILHWKEEKSGKEKIELMLFRNQVKIKIRKT